MWWQQAKRRDVGKTSGRRRLAHVLRKYKGDRSEVEFARRIGISHGSLNRILNRDQNVTLDTLDTIARSLGLDIRDLLKEPGED